MKADAEQKRPERRVCVKTHRSVPRHFYAVCDPRNRRSVPRLQGIYSAKAAYRKITIWPRVQEALGLKVVSVVPAVRPVSIAQRTALA